MAQTIDFERLKQIRRMRGLTQDELAKKARLNKQTIYRLEKAKKPLRKANLDRLAEALAIEPGVLTGEMQIPADIALPQTPEDSTAYQLNVRVDGKIRNAFSLAALHYKVPLRRIVELAPLLFVLAAEGSLRHRRDRLAALEATLERAADQWLQIPHLPSSAAEPDEHREIVNAEKKSIAARDLFAVFEFGKELKDRDDLYEHDSDKENPFAIYLRELAEESEEVVIEAIGSSSYDTDYSVCWSEAVDFADGDQELAIAIDFGLLPIHEVLREFQIPDHLRGMEWTPEGVQRRIEWMRRAVEPEKAFLDRVMQHPDGWMQERGVAHPALLLHLAGGDEPLAQKLTRAVRSGKVHVKDIPAEPSERIEWIRGILEPTVVNAQEAAARQGDRR